MLCLFCLAVFGIKRFTSLFLSPASPYPLDLFFQHLHFIDKQRILNPILVHFSYQFLFLYLNSFHPTLIFLNFFIELINFRYFNIFFRTFQLLILKLVKLQRGLTLDKFRMENRIIRLQLHIHMQQTCNILFQLYFVYSMMVIDRLLSYIQA